MKMVRGCVQIIDVGDYGKHGVPKWWQRMFDGFQVGKEAFKIFDLNFPETTRKIFIVRTGSITMRIYRMVQPMVPPRTQKKMKLCGWDAAEWADDLQAEMPSGCTVPGFLTNDSDAALASARPLGGLVPTGGVVDEARLEAALRCSKSTVLTKPREDAATEPSADHSVHARRLLIPFPIILVVVIAAALSGARALSLMDFGIPGDV
mmetsp:Transcript_3092/g.12013  ORF Transcript_3092/g.12013 Transcript_3092/m.12013 type:complete len:206 (+) Transcript_3092:93-710(+)